MDRYDVLIVGAGAAGLMASRLARHMGKRALTLEARDRLGGRMWTVPGGDEAFAIELGAEYVHGPAPVTERLARDFGLSFVEVADRHFRKERGEWTGTGEYWERLGRAFARIPTGTDLSFADFARETLRGRDALQAVSFVESFHGAPADDISALSLRETTEEFENTGQARRILGGYGRLINKLAGEGGKVELRAAAERVRWRRGRVEVVTRTRAGRRTYRAKRVLITLPAGVLKSGALAFEPALPATFAALEGLGMGDALRLTARLPRPLTTMPAVAFWHDEKGELPVWWSPGPEKRPIVTAWVGGPRARKMLEHGLDACKKTASENFTRLSGIRGAKFSGHDWRHDIFSRGAYSYARVNKKNAAEKFSRAISRTIFFAGEATISDGENATVEGALASAERAMKKIFI